MPATPVRQSVLGVARKLASPRVKAAARRAGGRPLVAFERRGLTPELTVVMPVYNIREYLAEALDSVLTQSLHNLELIAVDDGSTDGSLDILRRYERRDPRVRVFSQSNSGQGIARNVGVSHARGEFLTFVDSDDTVPPQSFSHMVAMLRRSGSDFCVGSVRRFKNNEYMRTVWARTVHASDRLGTTIEQFPNAMQDIIACNRMFRTAFWRDKVGDFRGHIAYEDHVPMLTAYVRAEKFDILRKVTYNWRVRENLTSTGQQKARLENLFDRIAVKEEAHELLQAEASDFVYDTWVGRTLEVDFPPFIMHAVRSPGPYRNILAATFQTYLGRATDRALDMVTVRQKVRAELVAQGRWEEMSAADAYFEDIGYAPKAEARDGRAVAVVPDDPELSFLRGHPDRVLRLSPLESHFEGVIQHIVWSSGRVEISGWAVLRALGITGRTAELRAWLLDEDGEELEVPVVGVMVPEANIWGSQQYAPYDGGGFVVTVDLDSLPPRSASWHLEVETTYDGITTRGAIHNQVRESAGSRESGVAHTWGETTATVRARWHGANGLSLDVDTAPVVVLALDAGRDRLTGRLRSAAGVAIESVRLQAPDAAPIEATTTARADGVDFSFPWPLPGDPDLWHLTAEVGGRRVTPLWSEDLALSPGATARWKRSPDGGPSVVPVVPTLEVTEVRLDDESISVTVHAPEVTEDQISAVTLANPRTTLPLQDVVRRDDDWVLTFGLRVSDFGRQPHPAPSARYELALDVPGGPSHAMVAPSYAGLMPQRFSGRLTNLRIAQWRNGRFGAYLEPALPPDVLGPANRRRLRDAYRSDDVVPRDSVLFGCYRGEFATDSQLALDLALASQRPELTRYWGVADTSTMVPEGSVPLLIGTSEWYDALGSSRFVCNNIDFGPWFRLRPHQRYLQTFHGYPFKSMGIDFWRSKGFSEEEVQREVGRRNREWDTLLMPSEECVAYYREQYEFTGDMLVTGYPRCDALVNDDAAAVRRTVLARLGVDEGQTVVLYAPTYRDKLNTSTFAARRFDALELGPLARLLGPGHTLLVRGHNNNQRELDRVTGMAQVVDVTDYPDINELTLASDVAVLDYSSLRFDWAITGKPMVFFVPDLEDYFALRRPLFPYEGTAPGPWTSTTEEVAAALSDVTALQLRYAADIEQFNKRFNALHDGHATDRVLAAFFTDRERS
jgi:CDP-glycerol glycerophosphotransferase